MPTVPGVSVTSFACVLVALLAELTSAADQLTLTSPLPHQVIQRTGVAPGEGQADVAIAGELPVNAGVFTWSYRVVPAGGKVDANTGWQPATVVRNGQSFHGSVKLDAGGWYRLELRGENDDKFVAQAAVEPIGVGEVFVIAGQSYATNTNEERHNVQDRQRRVVAYDARTKTWRVAYDPQPTPDGSDGGSIWPPLGDALAAQLQVPIGFANVAWGGTSSQQWMPGDQLHQRLVETGRELKRFRAVLWQQGESDVIGQTTVDQYVANLVEIRTRAADAWGFEPCWLLAKSTHHPTVYNDPDGEGRIRTAIDRLIELPGFCAGPDTDALKGENRGDINSRRHFSTIGQRRAAEMWRDAILETVLSEKPEAR